MFVSSHFTSTRPFAPNLPYPSHKFFPSPAWPTAPHPPPPSRISFVSSRYSQVIPTAINQLSDQIKAISGLLRTYDVISHGRWLFMGTDWQYLIVTSYPRRSADTILVHTFKTDNSSQQRKKKGFSTIFAWCIISHVHLALVAKMQCAKQDKLNNIF